MEVRNVISATDANGRSPLEQVMEVRRQFQANGNRLTPEMRAIVERAIVEADRGFSPAIANLQRLRSGPQEVDRSTNPPRVTFTSFGQQIETALGARTARTDVQETVAQAVQRVDTQVFGIIRTLPLPANVAANVTVEAYRAHVNALYQNLDNARSEEEFQEVTRALKEAVPGNANFNGLLDERASVTTQVRPVLHRFNELGAQIPMEVNQSATTRFRYAELLEQAGDGAAARTHYINAFANNQIPDMIEDLRVGATRAQTNQAPITDFELLRAAVDQNERRGGAANGKALEVENLIQEAFRQFNQAPENQRALVAQNLAETMGRIQRLSDVEFTQVLQTADALQRRYADALPPQSRDRMLQLERTMADRERTFSQADQDNLVRRMDPNLPAPARQAAEQALNASQGEWSRAAAEWQQLAGERAPALIALKSDQIEHGRNVEQALQNKFYSRGVHARMLIDSGNRDGGRAKLGEAFGAIPASVRPAFLARPAVQTLVTQSGADANALRALPEPQAVAVPPRVGQPPAPGDRPPTTTGQPPAPGDRPPTTTGQPAAPGDRPPQTTDAPAPAGNPRFAAMSIPELEAVARSRSNSPETMEECKEAYTELIRRWDSALAGDNFRKSVEAIQVLQRALEAGKELVPGPDGQPVVGTEDLSPQRRFFFHSQIIGDMEVMQRQVAIRQEFAQILRARRQFADAERVAIEATQRADQLPVAVMRRQNELLVRDLPTIPNGQQRQAMQEASRFLIGDDAESGAIKLAINTRKFLVQLYLGTEIDLQTDGRGNTVGVRAIRFGQTSAFKPDRAYEVAQELRQRTRDILGFDPMDREHAGRNPGVTSLFAGLVEVFDDPNKYNLYNVVQDHQVDNIRRSLKENSGFDSMLVDMGVVVLATGVLLASRNPRVAGAIERCLGVSATNAGRLARAGGVVAAPALGVMARHYGMEMLTGQPESWGTSIMHTAGSLAAAEVGSRMLGRGSLFLGEGSGARAFRSFDRVASAEWMARNGYDTTGKLTDALAASGFADDAARFAGLPRTTAITSEEALAVIERAGLTHNRLAGVADALGRNARAAGVIQDRLVANLTHEGRAVSTVDDLVRVVEADQRALAEIARRGTSVAETTAVADAIGLTAEQKAVIEGARLAPGTEGALHGAELEARLGAAGFDRANFNLIMTAERLGMRTVGDVNRVMLNAERLSFDALFPRLSALRQGGHITGATTLADVARNGTLLFEGNGLNRLLALVPEARLAEVMTPEALRAVRNAAPLTGDRPGRIRAAWLATQDFGRSLISSEGRGRLWTGLAGPEGLIRSTIPTRLGGARTWVNERFNPFNVLDPATATPNSLIRARFNNAFWAAGSTALVYNSTARTWDFMDRRNPDSSTVESERENYTFLEALREANFPTVHGEKNLFIRYAGSTLMGTPGQALFGAALIRQGGLRQEVWGNQNITGVGRYYRAFSPTSFTRWHNWNAGLFTHPGRGGVAAFTGTQMFPLIDEAITAKPAAMYNQRILREIEQPITNMPLPQQREIVPERTGGNPPPRDQAPPPGGTPPAPTDRPAPPTGTQPPRGDQPVPPTGTQPPPRVDQPVPPPVTVPRPGSTTQPPRTDQPAPPTGTQPPRPGTQPQPGTQQPGTQPPRTQPGTQPPRTQPGTQPPATRPENLFPGG